MVSNGFPLIQDSSSGNAIQIGSPEESVRGEGVRFSDSLSFRFLVSPSYLLMFVIFFGLKMHRMVGPLVWMTFPWKPNNTERNWHFEFVQFDASLNVLLARQVMFACLNLNLRGWKTHTQTCNKSQELRTRSLNFFFYLFIAFFYVTYLINYIRKS